MIEPTIVGRRVKSAWHRIRGVIVEWEPLGASPCDALVRNDDDGRMVWCPSRDLEPDDGWGPLPSRAEAQARSRDEITAHLEWSRAQLIAEWHRPWPGAEFGKTLIGQSIDNALAELKGESK